MANNALSPEVLAMLNGGPLASGFTPYGDHAYLGPDGLIYNANVEAGNQETGSLSKLDGFSTFDQAHQKPGDPMTNYNTDGSFGNNYVIADSDAKKNFLIALAGALTMGFGAPLMMGASAAGGAGAVGAAGLAGDATAAGYAGLSAADAATLGGGASVGGGAALGGLGAAGAGAGVTGLGSGADLDAMYGGGSAAGGSGMGAGGAAGDGAGLGGGGAATGAGGGLLSGLGGAGSLTSLIGPALGALAGSQPQQAKTTTTNQIDPRMAPYIYGGSGQTGLLPAASGLLAKQMAPGYLSGYDDMRSVGQGLLNTPQLGNGFARFFPGR